MSRFTRVQKIIIGCITFFVISGFVFKGIQSKGMLGDLGYDAISMLRYGLIENPVHTLQNWMDDFANLYSSKEENDSLRYQLSQQPLYESQLEEANRRVSELEELLKMKESMQQFEMVSANVVLRDADGWDNQFTIDLGSDDGIDVGMIVLSSKGVIGKVYEVSKFTSKVKLLTSEDKQNSVAVKVSISDTESSEGVLQGYDIAKGNFVAHQFDSNDNIKEDMKVVTSGKGGVYPSGLLIGTVNTIEELSNSIGKTIYVKPAADFQNFDTVLIIKTASEE